MFQVKTHSVIIATGAVAKRLGLPHEEEFWSSGISACAVCDGASAPFRKQELAVVGGGDTAAEEALYLTKYGSKVRALLLGREALRLVKSDTVVTHLSLLPAAICKLMESASVTLVLQ